MENAQFKSFRNENLRMSLITETREFICKDHTFEAQEMTKEWTIMFCGRIEKPY